MARRDRPHILVRRLASAEPYQVPNRRIDPKPLPIPADRGTHGAALTSALDDAQRRGLSRRDQRPTIVAGTVDGLYLVFESFPGLHLALERLDPRQGKRHPELMAVNEVVRDGLLVERATVFVPDGTLGYFLKRLDQYVATASQDNPRHRELIDHIRTISLASLSELWTDPPDEFPGQEACVWWEVWLRNRDGREVDRLQVFATKLGLQLGHRSLRFADRRVCLVEARPAQLALALDVLDDVAELRRPRGPAEILADESAVDQAAWVEQLAARTLPANDDAPTACIVDTGVHQAHPLLKASLNQNDCHACDPAWGVDDRNGHGTEMAGLALYGDIGTAITSAGQLRLRHRLESVKLLPPPPNTNPRELYGAITAMAVSLVEIQAPTRRRVFSIATTADGHVPGGGAPRHAYGQPTSWSAAIDALAAGLSIATTDEGTVSLDEGDQASRRLFLQAAGNVSVREADHLTRSDLEPVEDPGQAWNALTVGAYTERDSLAQAPADYDDWTCVAPRGELSPFSRTSVAFGRGWPIKPDVVLEGGNLARSPDGTQFDTPDILQVLTTKAPLRDARLLTVTRETSAATAQAAYIASNILAEYPSLWPETVRALIVHSAEWTPAMRRQFDAAQTRAARVALHRRYGMGVPDLARATRSATDALVLVVQDMIHPFDGDGHMREMHLHDLPWPTEVLAELGPAKIRLRVTLSYFIEPNPGRRGWARRYSYPSHGLRFDVRRSTESTDEFRKRLNQKARDEEERFPSRRDADEWFFGPEQRGAGSLHTDFCTGRAADLARRGVLAVFPVAGWWKERKGCDHSDRGARYALVLSIETTAEGVDLWTPVAQEVGIPIDIET